MNVTPDPEFTREVVVNLPNGLHLVPSSQIVKLAQKFTCEIRLRKGTRVVDGKSVLDLITLAAEHGEVLKLEAVGADAPEALQAIAGLFERNFDAGPGA
ncbi:MAG: HPr family phosphocarrier protein [Planctomycetaceae bacterium]